MCALTCISATKLVLVLDLLIIAVTRSARFILRSNILYCKQVVKAEKTFEGVDGKTMLSGIHCVFQLIGAGRKKGCVVFSFLSSGGKYVYILLHGI